MHWITSQTCGVSTPLRTIRTLLGDSLHSNSSCITFTTFHWGLMKELYIKNGRNVKYKFGLPYIRINSTKKMCMHSIDLKLLSSLMAIKNLWCVTIWVLIINKKNILVTYLKTRPCHVLFCDLCWLSGPCVCLLLCGWIRETWLILNVIWSFICYNLVLLTFMYHTKMYDFLLFINAHGFLNKTTC